MADYNDILNRLTAEAYDFINNPSRMDRLLRDIEEKLRAFPTIGETLSGLPVMVAMVKSWIVGEYQVQPKVLATMVGALLYLVKRRDLIPDDIPIVGIADDLAVVGLALKFVEPELNAYREWRA